MAEAASAGSVVNTNVVGCDIPHGSYQLRVTSMLNLKYLFKKFFERFQLFIN